MPCHFEAISALRPFDDPDAVRQSGVGASPPRSWQHGVARAIMAYLLDALGADSQFERYTPSSACCWSAIWSVSWTPTMMTRQA